MRVRVHKKIVAVERMGFSMPSDELIRKYEAKKEKFLIDITKGFVEEMRKTEQAKTDKLARKELSDKQKGIRRLWLEGKTQSEIGEMIGIDQSAVHHHIKRMEKWGYDMEKQEISLEK